jgi:peptidyl-prolyl cis-trans isomerase SurA
MRSKLKVLCLVSAVLVCCGSVWGETLDRIVAVVNGDVILYSELQVEMRQMARVAPELNNFESAQRSAIEREMLNQMIRDRLADQELKRLKISVSQKEVDEAITSIKRENNFTDAQLAAAIQQSGQTLEQFRNDIRRELQRSRLVDRVFKSKTVITQEQINAFLNDGKSGAKQKRRLAIIFLPFPDGAGEPQRKEVVERGRELHRRLKGGSDFYALAKEYSKGPGADQGGDIGYIADDDLAPFIENAIRNLKVNEFSDVVAVPPGVYLIKVVDVQKEMQDASDASAREKAERQLFQNEVKRKFDDWVRELESRSFVQVSL